MWPLNGKEIFEMIHGTKCNDLVFNGITLEGIMTDSRQLINLTNSNANNQNDNNTLPFLFAAIQGEKFDGHAYLKDCFAKGIPLALVNRNSSYLHDLNAQHLKRCIIVDDVVLSLRKFAHAFRKTFPFPVIGIGGSNGKTTTKEILSSFLSFGGRKITKTQKSENGFLGIALTILQREHSKKNPPNALVLEIGIDEIGAMEKHVQIATPDVVLLTALGPEHLTGLINWETAAKEELILFSSPNSQRIWQFCDQKIKEYFFQLTDNGNLLTPVMDDIIVIEEKDKDRLDRLNQNILEKLKIILWSIEDIAPENTTLHISKLQLSSRGLTAGSTLFHDKIPLPGKHNAANFAIAFGAALALDLTPQNIMEGFQHFSIPPQRSKISYLPHDTILFDDTYNASPASVEAALETLKIAQWENQKKIIVLGDMLELGEESKFWHENLFPLLKELQDAHLCLFGPAMYNCYVLFNKAGGNYIQAQRLKVNWLDADHDPAEFLEKLSPHLKGSVILVKGSRGMRLERFVHCVENFFS